MLPRVLGGMVAPYLSLVWLALLPLVAQAQQRIFNGRDLSGWHGDTTFWSVHDGAIVGRSSAANPLTKNTFLIWNGGTVEHFELTLKFRISAENERGGRGSANSGVQYRSRVIDSATFAVAGYQADLDLPGNYVGMLYEERGRGILARPRERVAIRSGADEWNDYVILVEGHRHRFWVNGVLTVDYLDEDSTQRVSSGIIALQLHAGPGMRVEFKDIVLRRR